MFLDKCWDCSATLTPETRHLCQHGVCAWWDIAYCEDCIRTHRHYDEEG